MSVIALVGLPGSGKSTISRQLGRLLDCPVIDTDAVIEEYLGCSIADYFEREGEAAFREVEANTLAEVLRLAPAKAADVVLATGGGMVLRPENRQLLKEQAYTVYLHAQPDQLYWRLKNDRSRPLLRNTDLSAKLHHLYAQRHPLYTQVAAQTLGASEQSPQGVAEQILAGLGKPCAG